jgi:serine protease
MSLNVQGYRPEIELSDIIRAIDYATDNGAAIISFSMASPEYDSQALESAIIRARERGLLFICGIGNYESGYTGWYDVDDQESHHMYPGCFPEDNIISVLATDSSDDLGSYSMYGEYSVDVGAPGEMIKSTILGSSYNWASGTSFAAPHVAGVAALALGKCPALPYNVLKSRIMDLGDVLSSLEGKCVSERRLNAYNVVYDPNNPSSPSAPSNLSATPSAWDTIELNWSGNSNNEIGFEIQRYDDEKPVYMRLVSTGTNVHAFRDEHAGTWNEELNSGVVHTYRVRAGNLGGLSGFSSTASAQIPHTTPAAPSDLNAPTPVIRYVPFELTWADNADNEQTFSLQRKGPGSNWTEIAQLPANSNSYMDRLTQIGTYYYRIKAQNPLGSSSYSSQFSVAVEDQ